MKKVISIQTKREVTLDGMMTYGKSETGLHQADFKNYEGNADVEPFTGKCRVQVMRGGDVYIDELPRKMSGQGQRLFRQDNSTLSLGTNRMYYFSFWLPEELVDELPERLVRQANEAAAKMSGMFYKSKKRK